MGLGFVLLFWTVVLTVLAAVGAVVFGGATALLTRRVKCGRRRAIIAAALFPFSCLAWSGGVFVFQAIINEGFLHRDVGMGDTWHCPLPSGYQIMMIDVTDQGWVYNPRTQPGSGVMEKEDALSGVRELQIAGRYLLGGVDSKAFDHLEESSDRVDLYFLLDTQTGKRIQFQDLGSLRSRARELNIELALEPIYSVYSQYRFSWFEVFAGLLFGVPPLAAGVLLIWWIMRLRRTNTLEPLHR